MLVVSSPSGAGKTTLTRNLLEQEENVSLSISVTTRERRPSEIDGVHYHFISMARASRRCATPTSCSNGPRCTATTTARRASRSRPRSPPGATCCSTSTGRARSSSTPRCAPTSSACSCCRRRPSELKTRLERRAEDCRRRHRPPPAQRGRGNPALERIRLRAGQPRSRQELRAAARDPGRRQSA